MIRSPTTVKSWACRSWLTDVISCQKAFDAVQPAKIRSGAVAVFRERLPNFPSWRRADLRRWTLLTPRDTGHLQCQSSFAAEAPFDAAIVDDAGDVLAEFFLERRRPRHELEAEAVVDHREATGREG